MSIATINSVKSTSSIKVILHEQNKINIMVRVSIFSMRHSDVVHRGTVGTESMGAEINSFHSSPCGVFWKHTQPSEVQTNHMKQHPKIVFLLSVLLKVAVSG